MLTSKTDKPVFGQYACAGPSGAVLHVGDEVQVTDRVSRSMTGACYNDPPTVPQTVHQNLRTEELNRDEPG